MVVARCNLVVGWRFHFNVQKHVGSLIAELEHFFERGHALPHANVDLALKLLASAVKDVALFEAFVVEFTVVTSVQDYRHVVLGQPHLVKNAK